MIKLCYKEYPFKITLGAMREYKELTGKSLHYSLMKAYKANIDGRETTLINRLLQIQEAISFDDALAVFHTIIKTENSATSKAEIEDAMLKVSWFPNADDSDLGRPWPFELMTIVEEVNNFYSELSTEKKQ